MHEDVESEFVNLLVSEIGKTIDLEIKKALGMTPVELQYAQNIYINYTDLDGLEVGIICELHWLRAIRRCSKKKLRLSKKFPFFKLETVYYTLVVMNSGSDILPKLRYIRALESPAAMARKFGIEYNDTTADLIKDQLEHGDM